MKTYRVIDIISSFILFIGDEIEANDEYEAIETVFDEIMDDIYNYIDIYVEEVEEGDCVNEE